MAVPVFFFPLFPPFGICQSTSPCGPSHCGYLDPTPPIPPPHSLFPRAITFTGFSDSRTGLLFCFFKVSRGLFVIPPLFPGICLVRHWFRRSACLGPPPTAPLFLVFFFSFWEHAHTFPKSVRHRSVFFPKYSPPPVHPTMWCFSVIGGASLLGCKALTTP